jgi:hypothetical protein
LASKGILVKLVLELMAAQDAQMESWLGEQSTPKSKLLGVADGYKFRIRASGFVFQKQHGLQRLPQQNDGDTGLPPTERFSKPTSKPELNHGPFLVEAAASSLDPPPMPPWAGFQLCANTRELSET